MAAADRVVAPLVLFVSFYVATLNALALARFPFLQWMGLIAVSVATAATIAILERGKWPLGLFVSPRLAIPEFIRGCISGALLIGSCALLIVVTSGVHHDRGNGFPWRELFVVFAPAAVHEELLFRGYAFQKLHRRNRVFGLTFTALVFAALHLMNPSVSWLGLANIFLGGILLGLAYEQYERLWFPIGLHLAWNVTSGPILGHEVSGYQTMVTLFVEREPHGPSWLTGGDFGIEGSVWMTLTEVAGIVLLAIRSRRRALASPADKEHSE
jgi:membrane protease YdiL (CAAX protease family)